MDSTQSDWPVPSNVPSNQRRSVQVTDSGSDPDLVPGDGGSSLASGGRHPLVVFDFDGTLTRPDIFRLFMRQIRSRRFIAMSLVGHMPSLLMALRGGGARDRAKERLCIRLLGGLREEKVQAAADRTAQIVLRTALRRDTTARLRWHLASGHRVIVISASFEAYVKPVMAALGVHEVIATKWEIDPSTGSLTGRLAGVNVRGAAKVRLLEEYLDHRPCRVDVAYGNSQGDAALLAVAERAVWVRRRRPIGSAPTDLLVSNEEYASRPSYRRAFVPPAGRKKPVP